MKPLPYLIVLSFLIGFANNLAKASVIIDDFSAEPMSLSNSANGNAETRSASPLSGTIDTSYRKLIVRNFAPNQGTGNSLQVTSNLLTATRGPGPDSGDFVLNFNPMPFETAGDWDFVGLGGLTAMRFAFVTNTTDALKVSVQAEKWDSGFAGFTQSPTSFAFAPTGASILDVDLAPLNLGSFGAIDNLVITFSYDPQPYEFSQTINQSFSLSSISAIPEPSVLTLFVVAGAFAFARFRHRHLS